MFKLTKDSIVTKAWVTMILAQAYTFEQVPNIFGLREAVSEVLESMGIMENK